MNKYQKKLNDLEYGCSRDILFNHGFYYKKCGEPGKYGNKDNYQKDDKMVLCDDCKEKIKIVKAKIEGYEFALGEKDE